MRPEEKWRSSHQWALIALALAAPCAALAIIATLGTFSWWFPVLVLVLLGAYLRFQQAPVVMLVFGAVTLAWLLGVDGADLVESPWSLAMAWVLLVWHAAHALSSSLPAAAYVDRATWKRWGAYVGVVGLATSALWVVALLVHRGDVPGVAALMFLGLVAVGAVAMVIRRLSFPLSTDAEPS
ncbi:MAG: hypothetical protein ACRDQA_15705 [Nocardioidaceae bacterium]